MNDTEAGIPRRSIYLLTIGVMLNAFLILGIAVTLNHRQHVRDVQFNRLDHGVCGVLNTIPAGKYPPIDQARRDAGCVH